MIHVFSRVLKGLEAFDTTGSGSLSAFLEGRCCVVCGFEAVKLWYLSADSQQAMLILVRFRSELPDQTSA